MSTTSHRTSIIRACS
uniref:Uncharacterized protein n=1 Tax=Arundo donax TaxID=35708 RepID=A0A0A9AUY5_ARUDO